MQEGGDLYGPTDEKSDSALKKPIPKPTSAPSDNSSKKQDK